jgi:hypothetical protein
MSVITVSETKSTLCKYWLILDEENTTSLIPQVLIGDYSSFVANTEHKEGPTVLRKIFFGWKTTFPIILH